METFGRSSANIESDSISSTPITNYLINMTMKINVFLTFICLLLTGILGYSTFTIAEGHENALLGSIVSSICFASTLIPMIGLQYESSKLGVNIRILSGLFFVVFLISNYCYALWGINLPNYLIVNGIIFVIVLAILYKMMNIKDI